MLVKPGSLGVFEEQALKQCTDDVPDISSDLFGVEEMPKLSHCQPLLQVNRLLSLLTNPTVTGIVAVPDVLDTVAEAVSVETGDGTDTPWAGTRPDRTARTASTCGANMAAASS